jgi:hypothetical protein
LAMLCLFSRSCADKYPRVVQYRQPLSFCEIIIALR